MKRGRWRRALGGLLCGALLSKAAAPGCAAGSDPPSKINSLRVLAVTADKPYAAPGEEVHFTMDLHDGGEAGRPIQITWIGGCFDPEGDLYYACFDDLMSGIAGEPGSEVTVAQGIGLTEFSLTLPEDIISRRPPPLAGPHYGIAYVFFLACAGITKPLPPAEGGEAGSVSLPFGCFDESGARLGADSFVPGYTQVYSFADGRRNENPALAGLLFNGSPAPEGDEEDALPVVQTCPLSEDDRRASGCSADDPFEVCQAYPIDVAIDPSVAEIDPGATTPEGQSLREIVWVSYLADKGDLDGETALVSGAAEGYHADHGARWIPPPEPGIATLWGIARDSRGGATVLRRRVRVE